MTAIEWLGALVTLAGVWLTAQKKIVGWLAGIVGALIYVFICYDAKLYAESSLQLFYAGMGIYGWILWRGQSEETFEVKHIPLEVFLLSLLIWLFLMLAMGAFLERYADTDLPFTDASMTAAGLVLTWQMARRYLECWSGWIIADLLSGLVFIYKNLYPTAALYFILAALAFYGHQSWKSRFVLR